MSTQGSVGLNTQLKIGDGGSPEAFTLIPECKDFSGPSITQEMVDFTHQQSTGGYRERKPTFKSSGQITFNCNYIYGNTYQELLLTNAQANPATLTNFQLVGPDSATFTFSAYPSVSFTHPMNGPKEMQVTLELDGSFTQT